MRARSGASAPRWAPAVVAALVALALLAAAVGAAGLAGCGPAGSPRGAPDRAPAAGPASGAPANRAAAPVPGGISGAPAGPGFASRERLEEHYAKHGREFGDISLDEYLARAQRLRDVPAGGNILELRRPDGFARFDRATGAFGAYRDDGTIRTFFRPRDGEAYFRRQARRHGG